MTSDGGASSTGKGEATKARIVEAALALFREHGYEATTMRMVADQASVSLGNAYYYFASKDDLLQAFYHEIHEAHVTAAAPRLRQARTLSDRLGAVIETKLEVIEPYHHFAALLFRSAADPASPLNPFHPAAAPVRQEGEAMFAEALAGADVRVPKGLRAELPTLLWTWSMGLVLYWIHDRSPERAQTRKLAQHSLGLVVQCIRLASNPLLRPLRKRVLAMLRDLALGASPADA